MMTILGSKFLEWGYQRHFVNNVLNSSKTDPRTPFAISIPTVISFPTTVTNVIPIIIYVIMTDTTMTSIAVTSRTAASTSTHIK